MPASLSSWVVRGAYLFGLSFVITALIDFGSTVFPPRMTDLAWRYGALGLGAGYLQTTILGLLMIGAVAHVEERRGVVRLVGFVLLAMATLFVGAMAIFALDSVSMRAVRPPQEQAGVLMGAMLQELKYGMAALVSGAVGFGALKSSGDYAKTSKPGIVSSGK